MLLLTMSIQVEFHGCMSIQMHWPYYWAHSQLHVELGYSIKMHGSPILFFIPPPPPQEFNFLNHPLPIGFDSLAFSRIWPAPTPLIFIFFRWLPPPPGFYFKLTSFTKCVINVNTNHQIYLFWLISAIYENQCGYRFPPISPYKLKCLLRK